MSMAGVFSTIYEIILFAFLAYSVLVFLVYAWTGVYAVGALLRYKRRNASTDYQVIASNPNAPMFSLIAPAYNEGATIVENVRSLLSLYYPNLEIIIVNDGSKDDSISKLIAAYDLISVPFFISGTIPTKEIKALYKSRNPAFKRLVIVDKFNGGKADALNVGINISKGKYIVCIDVDCILEQDALLKLAKPFLDESEKRVIACGGVIRLANNCKVVNGKIMDVNLPRTWLGRTQVLEYIRAFVLGRMAWSRASGLILISGAFGAFDRQLVLDCGGYDVTTVGEDMELVVRMRRYLEERGVAHEVINIPEPLCWTEAPETTGILTKQRNRWMRGTMETLWKHRKLMFNPKYGKLGVLSLPYWFFFEFLGPLIEFSGYLFLLVFLIFGLINWTVFFTLFALVLVTGIMYSVYAVLIDIISYQVYTKKKDFFRLLLAAVFESFYFHPVVLKASVRGFLDYFKKTHSWGEMTRQGFVREQQETPFWPKIKLRVEDGLKSFGIVSVVFLVLYILLAYLEGAYYSMLFNLQGLSTVAKELLITSVDVGLETVLVVAIIHLIFEILNKRKFAVLLSSIAFSGILVVQMLLTKYFAVSQNLLGADLFYYKLSEIYDIVNASIRFDWETLLIVVVGIGVCVLPIWWASNRRLKTPYLGLTLIVLGFVASILARDPRLNPSLTTELERDAATNKWRSFIISNLDDLLVNVPIFNPLGKSTSIEPQIQNLDVSFPFLHTERTPDVLGDYFNKAARPPSLVIIIVEGLGHAYSSPRGDIGNFTPFLDSLRAHSLYWPYTLSTSGRTFSVLPSITGSLPSAKNGFLELESYPAHFNLINVFRHNGFKTGFFYGGNADFDHMSRFLRFSKVDQLVDHSSFSPPDKELPRFGGESWGFEDQTVLQKMVTLSPDTITPLLNIGLTLSSHSPFLINDQPRYERAFEEIVSKLADNRQEKVLQYKQQLITIVNVDDALREFFNHYRRRDDFNNTIFIITGDHAMPEIEMTDKIDRYRVPLIIYSPLLKQTKQFTQIVSHFDVAPSIFAYYRENYGLATPSSVAWVGEGLQGHKGKWRSGIPIMQSKTHLGDYVVGSKHLSSGRMLDLEGEFGERGKSRDVQPQEVRQMFEDYKQMNNRFLSSGQLLPDSLVMNFFNE